jgi:hypothetical protein
MQQQEEGENSGATLLLATTHHGAGSGTYLDGRTRRQHSRPPPALRHGSKPWGDETGTCSHRQETVSTRQRLTSFSN